MSRRGAVALIEQAIETGDLDAARLALVSLKPRQAARRARDAYFTPGWAVRAFLPVLRPILVRARLVVEPSAGRGDIVVELLAAFPTARIVAVDIHAPSLRLLRDRCPGVTTLVHDWLALDFSRAGMRPDVIVGNPPYNRAPEFVSHALAQLAPGGCVAVLLRLNWLASRSRADFHRAHPADVHVLGHRPSFTDDGRTDGQEYAWFVFWRDRPAGAPVSLTLLDCDAAKSAESAVAASRSATS